MTSRGRRCAAPPDRRARRRPGRAGRPQHGRHGRAGSCMRAVRPHRSRRWRSCFTSAAFGRPDGDFAAQFVAARIAPLDAGHGDGRHRREADADACAARDRGRGRGAGASASWPRSAGDLPRGAAGCSRPSTGASDLARIAVPTLLHRRQRRPDCAAAGDGADGGRDPGRASTSCLAAAGTSAPMDQPERVQRRRCSISCTRHSPDDRARAIPSTAPATR